MVKKISKSAVKPAAKKVEPKKKAAPDVGYRFGEHEYEKNGKTERYTGLRIEWGEKRWESMGMGMTKLAAIFELTKDKTFMAEFKKFMEENS